MGLFFYIYINDPRKVYVKRINEDNMLIELTFFLTGYTLRYISKVYQSRGSK